MTTMPFLTKLLPDLISVASVTSVTTVTAGIEHFFEG